MYVSSIQIQNFRLFDNIVIEFYEGLNVLIGENNSGKTTILKALELVFNRSNSKRLLIDDFYSGVDLDGGKPPEITIVAKLRSTQNEKPEDKAVVASWLTKLESPWEATLTYKFFLPDNDVIEYIKDIEKFKQDNLDKKYGYWGVLEKHLPKYVSRIYGGNLASKNRAEAEYLDKFDCELLDALRDVESKMFTGKNTILKQVLTHFLDFELKCETDTSEIERRKLDFQEKSSILVDTIQCRLKLSHILELANETGASAGGVPKISGRLEEGDIISVLKLMIEKSGLDIPIINNGLGYNNLIYISLVLSKLKMITSDEFGENAKIFPILLIEEPEAHLHPALQYNFLKFLGEEIEKHEISRQIFITTHSTHITAAVNLNSLICMTSCSDKINVAYPGKVFSNSSEDIQSKKYIERYIDATKSNMLFSKGVILVEGIAEQMLFGLLAECAGKSLEKCHATLVRVDGLTFRHFIKLFGAGITPDNKRYALTRKVACVLDSDPSKRDKTTQNARWKQCWPFEIGMHTDIYEYRDISGTVFSLNKMTEGTDNVSVFYNDTGKGKTFEYDLAIENSELDIMFSEDIKEYGEINGLLDGSMWEPDEIEKAKKAAYYLQSISKSKGENAFDLAQKLRENLKSGVDERENFKLPTHIKNAILWVCNSDQGDSNC